GHSHPGFTAKEEGSDGKKPSVAKCNGAVVIKQPLRLPHLPYIYPRLGPFATNQLPLTPSTKPNRPKYLPLAFVERQPKHKRYENRIPLYSIVTGDCHFNIVSAASCPPNRIHCKSQPKHCRN